MEMKVFNVEERMRRFYPIKAELDTTFKPPMSISIPRDCIELLVDALVTAITACDENWDCQKSARHILGILLKAVTETDGRAFPNFMVKETVE